MSRRTRTVLAGVALWMVIVAGTSTAAWLIIDRAGREVFPTDAAGPPEPQGMLPGGAPLVATGTPTSATTPPAPSLTTGPTPPSTRSAPRPTTPGSTNPTARTSITPLDTASTTTPPGSPPSADVSDSVTVSGGTVGVSCAGSTISLRYVTPRNGWSYEIDSSSRSIEVKFRRLGAQEESEVHATCSGGRPVFELSSGGAQRSSVPSATTEAR